MATTKTKTRKPAGAGGELGEKISAALNRKSAEYASESLASLRASATLPTSRLSHARVA